MKQYDFTLIRWTSSSLDPKFDYFFPEKEKFLAALFALGIKAKVLDTRKWNEDLRPFEKIIKEIETEKILLSLSEWAVRKDIETLLKFVEKEKKKLYVLVQAEENEKIRENIGKIAPYSEKIFVTLEYYKNLYETEYPEFSNKIIVLPYPVTRGRIFEKEKARKILNIKTPYVLICWGSPRAVKQFDKVLDLVRTWEDTTLLIAGTLEKASTHERYYNFLKTYTKKNNLEERVFFAEPLITHEDIDIWFSAADLKVYPHKSYACASVTYAIGHGKCVVTNPHPGFLELSTKTGIVPSEDLDKTVRELLENPQKREKLERKSLEYSKNTNWFEWTKRLVKELNIPIKTPPKIAVIIPVKNVESFIIRHLENWNNLCYPKDRFKLYFMDGYSTDKTRKLIEKYCKENQINYEIHLEPKYNNPINASGWIAETMKAFRKYLKDEEYVAIVDADIVYWNPFLLGQLLIEDVDIIAPYVYTEPTPEREYNTKSAATRYFYDCTLFRRDKYLFPKEALWKQEKGLIEMDCVGSFVLVKREVYDNCYWDNPLPTLQFLLDAKRLGYRIWTKPKARVFHRYFTNGHKSIEEHVKEGRLPKSVLAKVPQYLGFLPPQMEKHLSREKTYTWKKPEMQVKKKCPACLSKNLFINQGRVWCRGCGYNLGTEVEKYFSKPNVLIIIADALRYDYFMRSKVPRVFQKGFLFKGETDQIHTGRAVPVLLTGKRRENITINETRQNPKRNPETSFFEETEIKSITAWDIFDINGYNLGYINFDWEHQTKEKLLKENQISLFPSFPGGKNLETLLSKEPFFGVLHFWSTHSPYGFGTFPENCEKIYKKCYKLLEKGNTKELHRLYKHGVEGFEKQMKILKEILEERNLLENTLVVITADHGEALGESGRFGHAASIWEDDKSLEELRRKEIQEIPLLFYHPNFPRIHLGSCRQEDILPTILKLVGIKVQTKFDGKVLI